MSNKIKINMKNFFFIALLALAFCGCQNNNKSQQPSEADIEAMINERVAAKLAEQGVESNNVSASASNNNETDVFDSTPTKSSSKNGHSNAVGEYEFTDEIGNNWKLTLNSDKTATIGIKGADYVAYGSFKLWDDGELWVKFYDEVPKIWFPSGEQRGSQMPLMDGYIYYNKSSYDAKNPRNRISITKVK